MTDNLQIFYIIFEHIILTIFQLLIAHNNFHIASFLLI